MFSQDEYNDYHKDKSSVTPDSGYHYVVCIYNGIILLSFLFRAFVASLLINFRAMKNSFKRGNKLFPWPECFILSGDILSKENTTIYLSLKCSNR